MGGSMYSSKTKYMRVHSMGSARLRLYADAKLTTKEAFSGKTGDYTKHRLKVHAKWVKTILDASGEPQERPLAVMLGGGSASGKTFLRDSLLRPEYQNKRVNGGLVDVDKIKKLIHVYERKRLGRDWARRVHDEGIDVANQALNSLIEGSRNFILDGTMAHSVTQIRTLRNLKQSGYRVEVVFVDTRLDIARAREKQRQKEDKHSRSVPDGVILATHKGASRTFVKLNKYYDDWKIYNNDVLGKPVLIASKQDGILNPYLYKQFIEKRNI